MFNKAGQEIFTEISTSDGLGNWETIIEKMLVKEEYTLSVNARDNRGAVSYPTTGEIVKVKAKVVLSIGSVDLGWFEIFVIIILLVVSGTSLTAWYYVSTNRKREAYKIIAGRDLDKLSALLVDDLEKLEIQFKDIIGVEPKAKTEIKFHFSKIKETIAKMKKYLGEEIEELR